MVVQVDVRDPESCYRAVASRDRRFDGVFVTAVHSTGIYCRPSCPARTPNRGNVTFHRTAAAAQAAGYRACKRCLPDASPGSPRWHVAGDTAARAVRLIADGVVDRDGVTGLATRLGYSTRQLTRVLTSELGAGPTALARAQRAQNARLLLETTDWRVEDVAFAAGFSSVRQCNDTVREVYAATPTGLRRRRAGVEPAGGAAGLDLRVPVRTPFDAGALWLFLDRHVVPGVEQAGPGWYARTLRLPHGPGTVRVTLVPEPGDAAEGGVRHVPCTVRVQDLRDVPAAIERCRRLLDADCDPSGVDAVLGADPVVGALVRGRPGLRVPGHVDGAELALRTVLGQQVSLQAGNRLAAALVAGLGDPLPVGMHEHGLELLFPTSEAVLGERPAFMPMPAARVDALTAVAGALATGVVSLDRGAERSETRARLLQLRGVGPWTADYVAMRALGDPDIFLGTDAAARRVLRSLDPGLAAPAAVEAAARGWRPWRSYALLHLWTEVLTGSAGT